MSNFNLDKDYNSLYFAQAKLDANQSYAKKDKSSESIFNGANSNITMGNDDVVISAKTLRDELNSVQNEQGILGKAWNGFKNLIGLGLGSDKVEDKIKAYENGEISYEEALNSIQQFDSKQEGAVNLISNVATGVATAGFAVATGGVGAIVGGALIGGATKAGLKTVDRATNNIEGDALDGKQILKDGVIGAVDGAVSALTAGMIKMPVKGQTVKEAIKQGAIGGAKAGAISGATAGASEYAVEAAFEDDVKFEFNSLLKSTAQNALVGGIFGGVLGGITGGIGQKSLNSNANSNAQDVINSDNTPYRSLSKGADDGTKFKVSHNKKLNNPVDNRGQAWDYIDNFNANNPDLAITVDTDIAVKMDTFEELSKQSEVLASKFDSQIDEAARQVNAVFSDKSDIEIITARAKGQESIFKKLAKKDLDGKLKSTDLDSCYSKIGDALGIRIQAKAISTDESAEIVSDILSKNNIQGTYDDFVRYLNGDSSLDDSMKSSFASIQEEVIDSLKTRQMQGVVSQLTDGIKTGKIKITELNNYGNDLTSYFTKAQIHEIVDAYDYAVSHGVISNSKPFLIVNKQTVLEGDLELAPDASIIRPSKYKTDGKITIIEKPDKATKVSGYASSQMNTEHVLSDGTIGFGELQIRGAKLNDFADVEHIPYDIRTGKISINDSKYAEIYDAIKKMSDSDYSSYNSYLSDTYRSLRMQELGLLPNGAQLPKLSDYLTSTNQSVLEMIDYKGLVAVTKKAS